VTGDLDAILRRYPGALTFRYGDGPVLNAEILALVRAGRKTVSCDALAAFRARAEALPEAGRTDIALTWDGAPALAIRTLRVDIIPFDRFPADLVPPQAEFRDLDDWRQGYRAYLTRSGHFALNADMVVETFRLVEDFA
jgi:uncharacterized protein YhfF